MSDNTDTLELGPDPSEASQQADQAVEQPTDQATAQAAGQVEYHGGDHAAPSSARGEPTEGAGQRTERSIPDPADTAEAESSASGEGGSDGIDGASADGLADAGADDAGADGLADAGADGVGADGLADAGADGVGADGLDDAGAEAAGADGLDDAGAETDGADGADAPLAAGSTSKKGGRVRQLEREGEVAADFLETLLDIADLDGDIDVDVDGDRAAVAIVDSEEGRVPRRLVGPDGKVLEALQELTRLAVQAETGERSRLMLDVGGHRAQRRAELVELAATSIATVRESGSKQSLEPMSAFERKVVHDEVAAAGLTSESEGVEPRRHVVILP